jgi:hypothetical protein
MTMARRPCAWLSESSTPGAACGIPCPGPRHACIAFRQNLCGGCPLPPGGDRPKILVRNQLRVKPPACQRIGPRIAFADAGRRARCTCQRRAGGGDAKGGASYLQDARRRCEAGDGARARSFRSIALFRRSMVGSRQRRLVVGVRSAPACFSCRWSSRRGRLTMSGSLVRKTATLMGDCVASSRASGGPCGA